MEFHYELSSDDDDKIVIVGDHELDLQHAVNHAVTSMGYDDLIDPSDDWFHKIVKAVCVQNHFTYLHVNGSFNVETAFWSEVTRRQNADK